MSHAPAPVTFPFSILLCSTMAVPAILSGRQVYWCPDGDGYLPYCPSPTDPDDYTYCCTHYYLGDDKPSCCRFPIHEGIIIALFVSIIPLAFLLVFLYCWCCPGSRLNRIRLDESLTI